MAESFAIGKDLPPRFSTCLELGKVPRAVARSRKLRSFDASKRFGIGTCYDRVRRPIGQRD